MNITRKNVVGNLLFPIFLILVLTGVLLAQQPKDGGGGVLSVVVAKFEARNVDMKEALQILREANKQDIMIGFEESALKGMRPIDLYLENITVESVLMNLCAQDPTYHYEVLQDSRIVNIFPREKKSIRENVMDMVVDEFSININEFPQNIIVHIDRYVPEMQEQLEKRRRGVPSDGSAIARGSIGSILQGDAPKPYVHITLKNKTVRQILNAIVLYTRDHQSELGYAFPISWRCKFIVDEKLPDPDQGGGRPKCDLM